MPLERPLVAIDTESAGTRGAPHLVEVAAVRFLRGEALGHFASLVRPEVPIEPEAQLIHGIGEADVRDAPPAAEVLPQLLEFVGADWMIAHRARADADVLGFELARAAIEPPPGPLLDTLGLSKRTLPGAPGHALAALCEHLELEDGPDHRALSDATACWQVFEACVEELGGWDALGDAGLLERAGPPLRLADALPRRPGRRPSIVRSLERAIGEEALVTLVYGEEEGGPPVSLPVRPRLVYGQRGKGYLEGECLRSGTLKTYRLDRVHRVEVP